MTENHLADCPDCGGQTEVVRIGFNKPRQICGRFGCEWDGITLDV